jgi:predicted cupin superfamily sugar epimerase
MWHHYGGGTLEIIEIIPDSGELKSTKLGKNIIPSEGDQGEVIQYVVNAGNIFGSKLKPSILTEMIRNWYKMTTINNYPYITMHFCIMRVMCI